MKPRGRRKVWGVQPVVAPPEAGSRVCFAYEQLEISRRGSQVQRDGAVAGEFPCRGPKTGNSGLKG